MFNQTHNQNTEQFYSRPPPATPPPKKNSLVLLLFSQTPTLSLMQTLICCPSLYFCLFENVVWMDSERMSHQTFCIWFLSLNRVYLRFIQVIAYINSWFIFIVERYSIMWMYQSLLIHLVEGHLDCFWFLIIMDKSAINMRTSFCVKIGFHFAWVNT